jgi:lipoyl(octanoyl) transferase
MQQVIFQDLGRIAYREAWDYQSALHRALIDEKNALRAAHADSEAEIPPTQAPHHLLFCEHHPVFTLGKSGSADHLLLPEAELEKMGFEFFKINRGGDITYHGPGQIVGYPIFDLERFFTDVHKYVRLLEEAVIRTIAEYGLKGMRLEKYTGVWLEPEGDLPYRKICAIGVHLSRWVSLHGFAFNVNTDLSHFDYIVPCGIDEDDKTVTSLSKELGQVCDFNEVKNKLKSHYAQLFGLEYIMVTQTTA